MSIRGGYGEGMRYGIVTARRGWLGPGDVMNTLAVDDFAHAIQAKS